MAESQEHAGVFKQTEKNGILLKRTVIVHFVDVFL